MNSRIMGFVLLPIVVSCSEDDTMPQSDTDAADLAECQNNIAGLQTDVDGIKINIAGLQTDVDGIKININTMHTGIMEVQSEVDVLQDQVYTDNMCIAAVNAGGVNAIAISYDNTSGTLEASNVQDAVEELDSRIAGLGPSYINAECIAAIEGTVVNLASGTTIAGLDIATGPHFSGSYTDLTNAPDLSVFAQKNSTNTFSQFQTFNAGVLATTGIKVGNNTSQCDSNIAGTIRWTGTDFEGCNGARWVSLTANGNRCQWAMEFVSTSPGYIEIPHSASLNPGANPWTIELWARIDAPEVVLVSKITPGGNDMYKVQVESDGRLCFWVTDSSGATGGVCSGSTGYADSRVHHIAAVRSTASGYKFFVDGLIAGFSSGPGGTIAPTGLLLIGEGADSNWVIDGMIDEVRIWSRAIYSTDFVPQRCVAVEGGNLVGEWKFEEGVGTTISDTSGNNHDGTAIGNIVFIPTA